MAKRKATASALFADDTGQIMDHPHWVLAGQSADRFIRIYDDELIPLPEGSKFFTLPGRYPASWNPVSKQFEIFMDIGEFYNAQGDVQGVSAFLPPGYLRLALPAYACSPELPTLPLWAYCAVGWKDEKFVVPAMQVDDLWYWKPENFDDRTLKPLVEARLKESPKNRLLKHLSKCALTYHCFAGKNLFYGRGEAPLPTAPACNSACIGCLSLQEEEGCDASHERINFVPTPEEICEIAVPHLQKVEDGIVSFGQGCEGDPILNGDTLEAAVRGMREATDKGTINMNTNGSKPDVVKRLAEAGLDSIRISLNAVDPELYVRYYRPRGYCYNDVITSIKTASDMGVHVAINLLVFPGITDQPSEFEGLVKLVKECGVHMIQLRNLNIDPELYLEAVGVPKDPAMGVREFVKGLREQCPDLILGYFNRPKSRFSPKLKKL